MTGKKYYCTWNKCKTEIDDSRKKGSLFYSAGFCDFHWNVYRLSVKWITEFCEKYNIDYPVKSDSYKKYYKEFEKIKENAEMCINANFETAKDFNPKNIF